MICLDTHVAVWLYAGELLRIPKRIQERLEKESLAISPIVLLELEYLKETGRITDSSSLILQTLTQSIGLSVCTDPFLRVVTQSLSLHWTRDPFDRMIVAQAMIGGHALVTKDRTIHRHFPAAIW